MTTYYVNPGESIQSTINSASNGDTIIVNPGTYTENVSFAGKAITVQSSNPDGSNVVDTTIINGRISFDNDEDSNSILSGLTITGGNDTWGGGIYCIGSYPTLSKCVITENTAVYGGGIAVINTPGGMNVTIDNCIVRDNESSNVGGGILIHLSASAVLNDCTVANNESDSDGGGIRLSSNSSATLNRCRIEKNLTTNYSGGGISIQAENGDITLVNCIVYDNTAYSGGGLDSNDPADVVIITNCVFVGNTAFFIGGGGRASSNWTVKNSIFWGNTPNQFTGSPNIIYSDIEGGYAGAGNINSDPLFVDSSNNNFSLQSGSPCIDTGTNSGAPDTDILGLDRITDGNNDGNAICDIGAYEFASILLVSNLKAIIHNHKIYIYWSSVGSALSYNIYWGRGSGVTKNNGTKIESVTSPYMFTPSDDNINYYFIITAVFANDVESWGSEEIVPSYGIKYKNLLGSLLPKGKIWNKL